MGFTPMMLRPAFVSAVSSTAGTANVNVMFKRRPGAADLPVSLLVALGGSDAVAVVQRIKSVGHIISIGPVPGPGRIEELGLFALGHLISDIFILLSGIHIGIKDLRRSQFSAGAGRKGSR